MNNVVSDIRKRWNQRAEALNLKLGTKKREEAFLNYIVGWASACEVLDKPRSVYLWNLCAVASFVGEARLFESEE